MFSTSLNKNIKLQCLISMHAALVLLLAVVAIWRLYNILSLFLVLDNEQHKSGFALPCLCDNVMNKSHAEKTNLTPFHLTLRCLQLVKVEREL